MIHETKNKLCEKGFDEIQALEDTHGTIGYAMSFQGNNYCVVAKEYAYKNMASFMHRLVTELPDEFDYIFYSKNEDTFTLFDGRYLVEHANPSEGPSKKRDCRWKEINRNVGVDLESFINSNQTPNTLSGSNATINQFRG